MINFVIGVHVSVRSRTTANKSHGCSSSRVLQVIENVEVVIVRVAMELRYHGVFKPVKNLK